MQQGAEASSQWPCEAPPWGWVLQPQSGLQMMASPADLQRDPEQGPPQSRS